jgi:ADP-ribosylglycohydrolase
MARDGVKAMVLSLEGLSVGDAFGERFFQPPAVLDRALADRSVPGTAPWRWTDDTAMALSIVEELKERETIDQASLAQRFARRHLADPQRGYGGGSHEVLSAISEGIPWQKASKRLYEGQGSKGNGAAMRAAPLGAFFTLEPLSTVVEQAHRQAAVTHAHLDAQAGAVAVAVAAWCCSRAHKPAAIWKDVLSRTPHGPTRDGLERASRLGFDLPISEAVKALGSGAKVLSEDTVPFALWCAIRHLGDYTEAMWATVSGLGDRDTTCAIAGGLVALRARVPPEWKKAREPLP